ncbi:MAG: Ldh family oxidoreductase [Hyphomicrobiaceae bacterium]
MSNSDGQVLSVDEIHALVVDVLASNGCDAENASAIADTVASAERDGCLSHGLFRVPGYVKSLRCGAVDGKARPTLTRPAPSVLRADVNLGFSPLALAMTRPELIEVARRQGIAALALVRGHHFAALWPETEALAEAGLAAMAFTASRAAVAPAGARRRFFGTNPMAFAFPRGDRPPLVFDQASAAMARGEIQIAARDGHTVPPGMGIDLDGEPTTDPKAILDGAQLPFGGYKGSAIALMVELLAAGLIGEAFGYEAHENANPASGVQQSGELIIAMDPACFGDAAGWLVHTEAFFARLTALDGVRLPADRRRRTREVTLREGVRVAPALFAEIRGLL